ncbi:MAG: [acyl-carrier-protein] S-malonyltransferase [Lentisphaerae bacterium]|nr:MAG: [acyl-carrier-protein] S-malonyltransferase [Lentisphaerota bacterium]
MTRIHLFPGQGSQEVGMGAEVFAKYPEEVAMAKTILGYDPVKLCLEGPTEQLNQTQYTQPLLYLVEALEYMERKKEDPSGPDFVAGHSLGEYAALFAAGAFSLETGLKLVRERGRIMSEVSDNGGMAAVLGLSAEKIREALDRGGLEDIDIANLNSPLQTVISGPKGSIAKSTDILKEAGARRVVVLPVSGAFHSRYMADAAERFAEVLAGVSQEFKDPAIPCLANCTAQPYEKAEDIPRLLKDQITHGVRWVETMKYLLEQPEPEFFEIGPKRVLTGLLAQCRRG